MLEESLKLAQLYLTQGKLSQAIAICQKVLDQQPHSGQAYQILGQIFHDEGNFQKAMEAYTKAVEIQPDFAEARAYLGQLYKDLHWWQEAAFQYQKAIHLGLNWPKLHGHLGSVLSHLGDLEAAKNSCEKAIALDPNYTNAYFNLGLIQHQLGLLEEAIKTYQKLLKLEPQDANTYNNLGCVLAQLERSDEAIEVYKQGLKIKPDGARLHLNLGETLVKKQQPEAAIAHYFRAIELEPELAVSYYNLGKVLQAMGEHQLAVDYFEKALTREPKDILCLSDCGFSLMAIGKVKQAIACWQQAIVGSDFINYYCQGAETYLIATLTNNPDELDLAKLACTNFIKGLLKYDDAMSREELQETLNYLAETYLRFANVFMEYGDYENAQLYYQKALQTQPHNFDIYWRLGNSLCQQKRYKAAIIAYHISLKTLPNIFLENYAPTIYYNLGKALEKQENWEQALEYYNKVLKEEKVWIKDQKLYKKEQNQGSSYLVTNANPQGFYLSTQDWIKATNIDSNNYVSVSLSPRVEEGLMGENGTVEKRARLAPIEVSSIPIVSKPGCNGLNCSKCLKRIYWWFKPKYQGEGLRQLGQEVLIEGNSALESSALPTYVAKIEGGRAWIMPKKSYWMLCHAIAIITPDNYLLADISRDYPGELPGCDQYDPSQHLAFSQEEFPPAERIDGTVAVLSSLSGNVYFHWMVDLLPRIEILRRGGINLDQIDWFLVNNYQSRFQQETLRALGIPQEKILASDRHPHLVAKELIVPSFGSHLGWLQPWGLKFLREVFLTPKVQSQKCFSERIYISRENAKYRRVLNEPEVKELLGEYGFITVSPENLSLEEQIAMFAGAKIIIAPHGSGLTNIIFCQPGTKVIELISPHYLRYYYWGISQQLGLEHYYLPGEVFSCYPLRQLMYSSPLAEDIMMNLKSLKRAMQLIGCTSTLRRTS